MSGVEGSKWDCIDAGIDTLQRRAARQQDNTIFL